MGQQEQSCEEETIVFMRPNYKYAGLGSIFSDFPDSVCDISCALFTKEVETMTRQTMYLSACISFSQ